jgi:hypothetical protein
MCRLSGERCAVVSITLQQCPGLLLQYLFVIHGGPCSSAIFPFHAPVLNGVEQSIDLRYNLEAKQDTTNPRG